MEIFKFMEIFKSVMTKSMMTDQINPLIFNKINFIFIAHDVTNLFFTGNKCF